MNDFGNSCRWQYGWEEGDDLAGRIDDVDEAAVPEDGASLILENRLGLNVKHASRVSEHRVGARQADEGPALGLR